MNRQVAIEPPFRPFSGHRLPYVPPVDDGRKPTFLSSFVDQVRRHIAPESSAGVDADIPEDDEEPEPERLERDELTEIQVMLPADAKASPTMVQSILANFAH